MELKVVLRGALAGLLAGILGFIFAKIFAEPQINKAIDYESGRDSILEELNKAAGHPVASDGPEIFSRTVQSTVGVASGIIAFSTAMGALVAVAYLVLHGRFGIRPRTLGLLVAGFGFLGVYLVPFLKYPANPPAIGHAFTITTRGHLYLTMVAASLILLGLAVYLGIRLQPALGRFHASLAAAGAFVVVISILMAILPSFGDLAANLAHQHELGFPRASTETPQPISNPQGQLVYPGFPADVLWKFRFYSVINQAIIWATIGLVFSNLVERMVGNERPRPSKDREPVGVYS